MKTKKQRSFCVQPNPTRVKEIRSLEIPCATCRGGAARRVFIDGKPGDMLPCIECERHQKG